jgi:hypothetical protein
VLLGEEKNEGILLGGFFMMDRVDFLGMVSFGWRG